MKAIKQHFHVVLLICSAFYFSYFAKLLLFLSLWLVRVWKLCFSWLVPSSRVVSLGKAWKRRAEDRRGTRDARLRKVREVMGRWKRKGRDDWYQTGCGILYSSSPVVCPSLPKWSIGIVSLKCGSTCCFWMTLVDIRATWRNEELD